MSPAIDLTMPENLSNPYPLYAELRRSRPVCRVEPGGLIAVSRYKDVEFVLRHPEIFSSEGFRVVWEPEWVGDNPLARTLVSSDGAEHARLRSVVSRAFTPAAINRLGARIRANAARLADDLRERGEADFMEGFAVALPARAMSDMLGMDPALERHYKRWTDTMVGVTPAPASEEHAARTRATIAEMKGYMQQVIDDRRRKPSDDLIGLVVRAEADGALSDREILGLCFNLLAAGLETTTFLLGSALMLLSRRADVLAQVRADRGRLPRFIEEVLRYDGPVRGLLRIATADVELSGVTIERGSCVLALPASANRDEEKFPDADSFDMDRERSGISFGHGTHYCIGAFLARMEAQAGLEALLDRFSGFTIVEDGLEWGKGLVTGGPVRLPVRFLPS